MLRSSAISERLDELRDQWVSFRRPLEEQPEKLLGADWRGPLIATRAA
jgi:hypothetical protein